MAKASADRRTEERVDKRRTFYLNVATLLVTSAVSAYAAYASSAAKQVAASVAADRMEILDETTLDASPASSGGWKELQFWFSPSTGSLGLAKQMTFARGFPVKPKVLCSLSGIAVTSTAKILRDLGYSGPSIRDVDYSAVRVDVQNPERTGFELRVSIPLSKEAIDFVKPQLERRDLVDRRLAHDMYTNHEIAHDYELLTSDDVFMVNFERFVGTIDVACVAQASLN